MKRTIISIILLILWQNHVFYAADLSTTVKRDIELFPGVEKISDDLYVGKVADDFYLAMERIGPDNIDMWQRYADIQIAIGRRMWLPKYLPGLDGSHHFKLVLSDYKSGRIGPNNEIWVAYASNIPVTKKARLNVGDGSKNSSIEMFVSVATSPEALITSHMGISRTWEAAKDLELELPGRRRHPNQSIHLHSFAAKVMKMRNPKRVYMLTAPAPVMRSILLKNMPNSVFVGDSLYKERLEAGERDPSTLLSDLALDEREGETADEREKRLKEDGKSMYDFYKIEEKISLLKTNPPRIIRVGNRSDQILTIQNPNGTPLVTFDKSSSIYQWLFTEAYFPDLTNPYVLVELDKLAEAGPLVVEPVELFPGVKKISDDLYVGKDVDGFYLAMERIGQDNIDVWQSYFGIQEVSSLSEVLSEYKTGKLTPNNQIWVAYVSNIPVEQKARLNIKEGSKNPSIEMFGIFITSPKALIASPIRTIHHTREVLKQERRYPWIYLNSFAAKVMKMRNPKRVYMLAPPERVMFVFFLKHMPQDSVFVGDSLYKEKVEAAEKDPNTLIKERISLLKTNPPRIIRLGDRSNQILTIQNPDGTPLVTFDKSSPIYQWPFALNFSPNLYKPYLLIDLDKLAEVVPLIAEPAE